MSPRWTTLDYVVDVPANASGATDVTISVAGHPELVLFTPASADASAGSLDLERVLGAVGTQTDLTIQIATTSTPDGAMAATAQAQPKYACSASGQP
jgi:hypothetical protein